MTLHEIYTQEPENFALAIHDLPDTMDKNSLIAQLLFHYGEYRSFYDSINVFLSYMSIWFSIHKYNVTRLWNIAMLEYNPIENYNRNEETKNNVKKTRTLKRESTYSGSDESTEGSTNTQNVTTETKETASNSGTSESTGTNTGNTQNDSSKMPINGSAFHDTERVVTTVSGTTGNTGKTSGTGSAESNTTSGLTQTGSVSKNTASENESVQNDTESGSDEMTETTHIHGNIGVTTTQQMANAEIDLISAYNAYDRIAGLFARDMLILI